MLSTCRGMGIGTDADWQAGAIAFRLVGLIRIQFFHIPQRGGE
ncbi:hypothetical protein BV133_1802 [Blastochloris viridis]|uniref:Uncharacterized protein n=1 Tax=Blastochloris viridis TaxID=1079 RepID=A0A182D1U2_BLAVI|nr:hypothetical protein BV133_1802 [Blastochloris viridis]